MRGIPSHPVTCTRCGRENGCPKDRLCHCCRLTGRPNPNKRFCWSTSLDDALRRAYRIARNRSELTRNLNQFQHGSGFTRVVILSRAGMLGLSIRTRRPWTSTEVEALREKLGQLSTSQIARHLGRTYYSVKARIASMRLSSRISEGYSQQDVQQLFGVGAQRVRRWITKGWLQLYKGRVTEKSLARFLRQHSEEYPLTRVDEAWFKGMLFPSFGRSCGGTQGSGRRSLGVCAASFPADWHEQGASSQDAEAES